MALSLSRESARSILVGYGEFSRGFNVMTEAIGSIPDLDEQRRLRRALAGALGSVIVELVEPILAEYPDLDAELLGG